MPKPKPTVEQKQLRRIRKQWSGIHARIMISITLLVAGLPFLMMCFNFMAAAILFMLISVLVVYNVLVARFLKQEKTFLMQLDEAQIAVIQQTAASEDTEQEDLKTWAHSVLAARENAFREAEKELLRASSPSHDGMLLRPTMENYDTPKEELLRASEPEKTPLG